VLAGLSTSSSPVTTSLCLVCRYERKKNIALAISALQQFKAQRQQATSSTATEDGKKTDKKQRKVLLVVAGGYDLRVAENVEYLEVRRAKCLTVLPCTPALVYI
jgi:hypothetical protein